MRGLFVTGTDTGVGKTVLSACLVAAMAAEGEPVAAHKPVLTGLAQAPAPGQLPADHELLGALTGAAPEQVAPLRFAAAASPHLAAELEGARVAPSQLLAGARAAGRASTLVVEGVGGLLVPLAGGYTVSDLAAELGLPLLIAAHPGLGTINHTLLTLRAARAGGLAVAAVVLTPWPDRPSVIEQSNRATIERLGEVQVCGLARVAPAEDGRWQPGAFARAGAALPWRRWLGG